MLGSLAKRRKNVHTGKETSLINHPSTLGKEHEPLSETGHQIRDTLAERIKFERGQRTTNAEIRELLHRERMTNETTFNVIKDPHRISQEKTRRLITEYRARQQIDKMVGGKSIDIRKLTRDARRAYAQLEDILSGRKQSYDREIVKFLVRRIKSGILK